MAVSITITLTGPFEDSDAQALQMVATGVAIMAGGELAAQIAANTEAAERLAEEGPADGEAPEEEHRPEMAN